MTWKNKYIFKTRNPTFGLILIHRIKRTNMKYVTDDIQDRKARSLHCYDNLWVLRLYPWQCQWEWKTMSMCELECEVEVDSRS